MYYSSFVLLAVGELTAELQAGTGRADQPVASTEPISGASVPRRHALVPYTGPRRRTNGDGANGGRLWAALDWVVPGHVVRRSRQTIVSARDWVDGAVEHIRADVATAVREVGAAMRAIGEGSLICAAAAIVGLLGALSLLTGVILVIGDQWLPRDWYALAALMVAVVAGIGAWIFVRRGLAVFSSSSRTAIGDRPVADRQLADRAL
jgi:hypothetical protein